MNNIKNLKPEAVWSIFDKICSIPHISGHEEALATAIEDMAKNAYLSFQRDVIGNLRIDRKAHKDCENYPHILMQAHLDMVPQSNNPDFNFLTTPITPQIKGDYLYATDTTLGADNGIGVAIAMAMLLDPTLKCGKLSFLATLEEETGLSGALNVDPKFLECDYLLNLDSEEEGIFYIGCAGGSCLDINIPLNYQTTPANFVAQKVILSGLLGGHSGCDIDKKRGNAIQNLCEFLNSIENLQVASIDGGSVDNAIPREASAIIVLPAKEAMAISAQATLFANDLKERLAENSLPQITINSTLLPPQVLSIEQTKSIINQITTTPVGVVEYDHQLNLPQTSNSLASVHTDSDNLHIVLSQRSLIDKNRDDLSQKLVAQYSKIGGDSTSRKSYPGWTPHQELPLFKRSLDIYENMFGTRPPLTVIHAGLECGIFAGKNPNMQMISFGPTIESPHSPQERVEIASVERFWDFLWQLICFNDK